MNAETTTPISLEPRVILPMSIDDAREATTAALKAEGFGVLTRIDVQATMKEKLGESFDPYLILGACNPALAHRALSANMDLGLLLPCNVTLHESNGQTRVSIVDPLAMLGVAGDDEALAEVAREARDRLIRVADALGQR